MVHVRFSTAKTTEKQGFRLSKETETKESSIYSDGKKVKCLTIIRYSIARIK